MKKYLKTAFLIIFMTVTIVQFSGADLYAEKQPFVGKNMTGEEIQKYWDELQKNMDENAKPAAIGVWDSVWFRTWLVETMKTVQDPSWYTAGFDPSGGQTEGAWFKDKVNSGIEFTKKMISEAMVFPLVDNEFAGAYFTASCWEDWSKKEPCIKVGFSNASSTGKAPVYKDQLISTLVHEGIHAFFYQNNYWKSVLPMGIDNLSDEIVWYDLDHCITWGMMLGPSTGNIGVCKNTIQDIEQAYLGTAVELSQKTNCEMCGDDPETSCFPKKAPCLLPGSIFNCGNHCSILNIVNNLFKQDSDADGLPDDDENNSIPPTSPWLPDSDMDDFEHGVCTDNKDRFPTDPTECFDNDNDGVGNMHDPCPNFADCDGDGFKDGCVTTDDCNHDGKKDGGDGQPFNKYCSIDKDRDGLCGHKINCAPDNPDPSCKVPIDPNDSNPDSDNDGVPDYADVNPGISNPGLSDLKPGFYEFDMDDDGLCLDFVEMKDQYGKVICKAGPDICPLRWDCDGDWVSDGINVPSYIKATISLTCDKDKDGDGLCYDIDPDDDSIDADGDKIPDYADEAPLDADNKQLKKGFSLFDIDGDGVCNYSEEEMKTKYDLDLFFACSSGFNDTCPWKWDCNGDGISDGDLKPSYSFGQPIYKLTTGPDPWTLNAADILNQVVDDPDFNLIGRTFEKKMGVIDVEGQKIWPDLVGKNPSVAYNIAYNPNLNMAVPQGCNPVAADQFLDYDFDGQLNCTDDDIDGDGLLNFEDPNPNNPDADCDGSFDKQDCMPEEPYISDCSDTMLYADIDHDNIDDGIDNCVGAYNPEQEDSDNDGFGDICDGDSPKSECKSAFPIDCNSYVEMKQVDYEWCEKDGVQVEGLDKCGKPYSYWEPTSFEKCPEGFGGTAEPDYTKQQKWFAEHPNCHKKAFLVSHDDVLVCEPAKTDCISVPGGTIECKKTSEAVTVTVKVEYADCMVECCGKAGSVKFEDADTDDDGIKNSKELELGTDPMTSDSDGDGDSDLKEVQEGTNPVVKDTNKYSPSGVPKEGKTGGDNAALDPKGDDDGDGWPNGNDSNPKDAGTWAGSPGTKPSDTGDWDGDGVFDVADNCKYIPNPKQGDIDLNGTGDACENIETNFAALTAQPNKGCEQSKCNDNSECYPGLECRPANEFNPTSIKLCQTAADMFKYSYLGAGKDIGYKACCIDAVPDNCPDANIWMSQDTPLAPVPNSKHELCNGIDDNNNGTIDEKCVPDADGDGILDFCDAYPFIPDGKVAVYQVLYEAYKDRKPENYYLEAEERDGCYDSKCGGNEQCMSGFVCNIEKKTCVYDKEYYKYKTVGYTESKTLAYPVLSELWMPCCEGAGFCKGGIVWKDQLVPHPIIAKPGLLELCSDKVDNNCNGAVDEAGCTPGGDKDSDGVADNLDNCPAIANADQSDQDMDLTGDVCDTDNDNDGVLDDVDNCPLVYNPSQLDGDNDGIGIHCDEDFDNDGVSNANDNCPNAANADQKDTDGDKKGDVCDVDDDGDMIADVFDNCPLIANKDQADKDGDGKGDVCDSKDNDSKSTKGGVCKADADCQHGLICSNRTCVDKVTGGDATKKGDGIVHPAPQPGKKPGRP